MGKVPLPVLKELEHQARQNLSTINFTAAFAKTSSCNTTMEKCQHHLKSTFKKVKTQIQKGANPKKAARHGYDTVCDYFEVLNKTILIQQRALACLSKYLAHILQRELYSMGNTGLLRCEAEMTLLQPHLGDIRHQELRNSPIWPSSLFKSQLVREGEDFTKKAPLKTPRVSPPTKISPFVVPTTRKEATTRNAPMGATPPKAVINRFPQSGENRTTEASEVVFNLIPGGEGVETPPPNDSSIASLSPPVGGRLRSFRRDWQINKCSDSILSIITKNKLWLLASSLFCQEHNRKGGKCKSLWFYSRLFLVPKPHQRWRLVIDLNRLNTFLLVERFKMETSESIRASLIPGEWVWSIDLSDAYLHIPIHPNSRKYLRFLPQSQVF